MKNKSKIRLTLLALAVFAFGFIQAQTTLMFQNFEASKTALPAGWSINVTTQPNGGYKFGNTYGTQENSYIATHTYMADVDDWDNNSTSAAAWDTIASPVINCSGQASVFLSLSFMTWNDDGAEVSTIITSTDGGKTWTTAYTLPDNGGGWSDSNMFDLSSFIGNQANAKVGFTYNNGYQGATNGYVAIGMGVDNIDVFAPLSYDLSVVSQNQQFLLQAGKAYTFTGTINNYGGTAITSMDLNYSVNSGAPQVDNITGISGFNGLTTYNWTHSIPFTPAAGNYTIKFYANNLNGANADQNHKNDTLTVKFMAIDSIQPKRVLYEEGTGQSCVFCLLAAPNIDSVYTKDIGMCDVVSYHVPIPSAPDYMYSVTSPTTDTRANYYGVYSNGTPDAFMDGFNNLYPGALAAPNDFSTPLVAQEAAVGSPFKIAITSCTYNTTSNQFNLTANITAYGAFAAGLIAQVAIVADSITYTQDYSADDPQASFQPPIGTSTGGGISGGAPDYLYPYVLKFPHVAEQMLPNGSGTKLNAFTAGSMQTVTVSWTKNHPWSYEHATYPYDSSATNHMVVFVQTNSAIASAGVPAKYVFQDASALVTTVTGIDEVVNEASFDMFPNPANENTNLVFSLTEDHNVTVDIFNMLGEKVYAANQGKMSAGQHTIVVNSANLTPGVYTVKLTTDNATTSKVLVIQR